MIRPNSRFGNPAMVVTGSYTAVTKSTLLNSQRPKTLCGSLPSCVPLNMMLEIAVGVVIASSA